MIDWVSLIIVAVVSVGATAMFALLLSAAIRLLSTAQPTEDGGQTNPGAAIGAWTLLALIGAMVLFGLYLIIPQFH